MHNYQELTRKSISKRTVKYNKALGLPLFNNQGLVWYLKNMSHKNFISVFLIMFVWEDVSSFYFLKKRNSLNFRSFCVFDIG